ncbi:MAG: nucleoside deaminase [Clostridiales bacterium]|jgi:tRNA(Arg) A34 adenosine deaminase TadA|nr:nucleoside deaminase [Clostridiales bacterium]
MNKQNKINPYMKRAVLAAKTGIAHGEGGPFGAVIVKDGVVVATAHNTVLADNDPTAHAEINAIRIASKKLKTHDLAGCRIYSTAEPCPMCAAALKWANIEVVYYGCTQSDTDKIGFRDKKISEEAAGSKNAGVMQKVNTDREVCMQLFEEWTNSPTKKLY